MFASSLIALSPPHLRGVRLHRNFLLGTHLATLVAGFIALYVSLQLLQRKKVAYFIATITSLVLLLFSNFHGHQPWHLMLYGLTFVTLLYNRSLFNVKSNNLNASRAVISSMFVFMSALTYGAVGFYFISKQAFNLDFTVLQSIKYSFLQIVTLEHSAILPASRSGHLFLLSLDIISIAMLVIIISNLFRPVRFALFSSEADREQAKHIITKSSSSVEDFFKLFPADKHYFFNAKKDAVLAYKVQSGVALILDGPSGNCKAYPALIKSFLSFCTTNDWLPSVIHADAATAEHCKRNGFKSLFIGNEARIDVDNFCLSTVKSKHFRYVENAAKRANLSVELWEAPLSREHLQILRRVSDTWLLIPGKREYTYVMGYFDDEYLMHSDVAVLQQDGRTIAYVNLIPSFLPGERSIDHMRHVQNIPSIGMHYLLKSLLVALHEKDIKTFNLGLSPLSGIDELSDPTLAERLLSSLKSLGSRYYSFAGLEQFKNKFKPNWEPRYILYTGAPTNLLRISNSLNRATALPSKHSATRRLITGLSLGAGIGYVSYLFAYILGVQKDGFVSELGAKGAPYNWLFNSLDVLVGIVIVALAYRGMLETSRHVQRVMFSLFAVGGVFNALAAMAPLHSRVGLYHWTTGSSGLHTFLSGVSILSLIASAALFAHMAVSGRRVIQALFLALLITSAIHVGMHSFIHTNIVQQAQLSLIGVFITLIGLHSL